MDVVITLYASLENNMTCMHAGKSSLSHLVLKFVVIHYHSVINQYIYQMSH